MPTRTIGLIFEPLDLLFFRGGRPFEKGLPGESSLPSPQSLAGMLRTFLLDCANADFTAMKDKPLHEAFAAAGVPWLGDVCFRGPWLAELTGEGPQPVLRAPSDLRFVSEEIVRLRPTTQKIPGWQPEIDGMYPLWNTGGKPSKARPELLTFKGLSAYLANGKLNAGHIRNREDFFRLEDRTGIGMDSAANVSKEGEIYATRSLRLKPGVAFYAEADVPKDEISLFENRAIVGWGGERHQVIMRRVDPVTWPGVAGDKRTSLLLLSPAFFERGWKPDLITERQIRSAAVDGPYAISGWDLARGGPKATRFGVDAGSVYFIEGPAPTGRYLNNKREDAALGFGLFLKGSWDYASE